MARMMATYGLTSVSTSRRRAVPRDGRLGRELVTLALGCAAAAAIALAFYLVTPQEFRDGVVAAFLGFDQPISPHSPLSQ
jgi:hypothetical protein